MATTDTSTWKIEDDVSQHVIDVGRKLGGRIEIQEDEVAERSRRYRGTPVAECIRGMRHGAARNPARTRASLAERDSETTFASCERSFTESQDDLSLLTLRKLASSMEGSQIAVA